jgi:hypothetical protein
MVSSPKRTSPDGGEMLPISELMAVMTRSHNGLKPRLTNARAR